MHILKPSLHMLAAWSHDMSCNRTIPNLDSNCLDSGPIWISDVWYSDDYWSFLCWLNCLITFFAYLFPQCLAYAGVPLLSKIVFYPFQLWKWTSNGNPTTLSKLYFYRVGIWIALNILVIQMVGVLCFVLYSLDRLYQYQFFIRCQICSRLI